MIVGRAKELETLKECLAADRSRLIVVYGRRRVGKTFLVREAFDYHFTFTHTGIEDGTLSEQLFGFWTSLREQWDDGCCKPGTWMEAFELLKRAIRHSTDDRKTIFIDELPWMDTRNSGFVKAVEAFWNGWASARKDVVMIVCGSAASWMVNKILQNRGGLFNRANRTIYLEPWTLHECEQYLAEQNNPMGRKDIAAAYMIFGGAPYYWSLLDKRESLSQSVDRLFFAPKAELGREFGRLYRSVFKEPEAYVSVVTALATKRTGLTRDELVGLVPTLRNDGTLTHVLENLETCAFVRRYAETGKKKKGSVYQLVDNFTLFYFSFVKDYSGQDRQHWLHMVKDQKRSSVCSIPARSSGSSASAGLRRRSRVGDSSRTTQGSKGHKSTLSSGAAIMSRIYVKSNTLPVNMKSALTKRSVFARRLRLSRVKPERTTPVI